MEAGAEPSWIQDLRTGLGHKVVVKANQTKAVRYKATRTQSPEIHGVHENCDTMTRSDFSEYKVKSLFPYVYSIRMYDYRRFAKTRTAAAFTDNTRIYVWSTNEEKRKCEY
jgi:hypothetical protein